jgi:protein involved in sex pheromone biosynthesis
MTTTTTITAKNAKNQSKINRCVKTLERYYVLNSLRDAADDNGDKSSYNKLNRQCEDVFDKYMTQLQDLPKYEQKSIEKL